MRNDYNDWEKVLFTRSENVENSSADEHGTITCEEEAPRINESTKLNSYLTDGVSSALRSFPFLQLLLTASYNTLQAQRVFEISPALKGS